MATNINTILNWFKTGFKPTQAQFWATWTSFWHKDEQIPQNNISGLEIALNEKAEKAQFDDHLSNKNAHVELFDKKANSIHTHEILDIRGLENILDEKALLSHKHEIVDIQGLEYTLNEKALLAHKHEIVDIKQLESTLNEKALLVHKHEITHVEGLANALNEKALLSHTHAIADIQGLKSTLNEKALLLHTHEITEIEGLKDQLSTKLTATLATDSETQIDTNTSEDDKVISPSKLFNWFNWIKSLPLKWNNTITTLAGTATAPALIIPNGVLTTTPQNGAIERDTNGVLWETHGGVRSEIKPARVCRNLFGAFFSGNSIYGTDIIFYTGSAQPGIPLYMWKGAEYNGNILNGIYPSSFNSLTQMNDGDVVETEITLTKGPVGTPTGTPYDLNINVYDNNIVKNTTVYSWDMRAIPYLTLKITLLREKNVNSGIYSHNYLISINGVVIQSLTNTGYVEKADCRLTFTSKSNVALYIKKLKTTNLFIPASII